MTARHATVLRARLRPLGAWALALFVAASLVAPRASADPGDGERTLQERRERDLKSFRITRSPATAAELAAVELDLGFYVEAADHLQYALAAVSDPEVLDALDRELALAKEHVATVVVACSVEGAEVFVDGRSLGRTPLGDELYLAPGRHVVAAAAADFDDYREEFALDAGSRTAVRIPLADLRTAPVWSPIAGAVGFGLGGAGLVIGLGLRAHAAKRLDDAHELQDEIEAKTGLVDVLREMPGCAEPCTAVAAAFDDNVSLARAADRVWIASSILLSGMAIYTGVALALDGASVVPLPLVDEEAAGLAVTGTF